MTKITGERVFLKRGSILRNYLAYPRFLLNMELNDSSRLIYILLLDRMRYVCRKDPPTDQEGNVYIHYEVDELAAHSGRGQTTVKASLRELERIGLICRGEHTAGRPRRIYVKVEEDTPTPKSWSSKESEFCPSKESEFCLSKESEFCPSKSRNSDPQRDEILTPHYIINKNNIYKTNIKRKYTFEEGESL